MERPFISIVTTFLSFCEVSSFYFILTFLLILTLSIGLLCASQPLSSIMEDLPLARFYAIVFTQMPLESFKNQIISGALIIFDQGSIIC